MAKPSSFDQPLAGDRAPSTIRAVIGPTTMAEEPRDKMPVAVRPSQDLPVAAGELPVVARLIVEVRSDGSRTIARGAMEDAASGTKVAVEANGSSPLELALGLAKSILSAPWLRRQAALSGIRALLKK